MYACPCADALTARRISSAGSAFGEVGDHDDGDTGLPEGGDLHRGRDVILQVEVQEHDVDREGRMADEFRPARRRDDDLNARVRLPDPGVQGGQDHLLVIHDGQFFTGEAIE